MKFRIPLPLLLIAALFACEGTKVDDQAAKELDAARDNAEAKADEVLDRAERALAKTDERVAALQAKAKAEGRELGNDIDAKVSAAKAKVQRKAEEQTGEHLRQQPLESLYSL